MEFPNQTETDSAPLAISHRAARDHSMNANISVIISDCMQTHNVRLQL